LAVSNIKTFSVKIRLSCPAMRFAQHIPQLTDHNAVQ
jgi:hypothetical protein